MNRRATSGFDALIAISQSIRSGASPPGVFQLIVEQAAGNLRAECCALVVARPPSPVTVLAYTGLPPERVRRFIEQAGEDWQRALFEQLAPEGQASFALAPFRGQLPISGALVVYGLPDEGMQQEDHDALAAFADEAAICLELTEHRQAAIRSKLLAALGEAVVEAPADSTALLNRVAHLMVPRFADWILVDLRDDDDGRIRQALVVHEDPDRANPARDLWADDELLHGAAAAMRSGISEMYPVAAEPAATSATLDADFPAAIRALGALSYLCVPLKTSQGVLGALTLGYHASGRRYEQADLVLAEEMARRTALALENANLLRTTQSRVQMRDEFVGIASHEMRTPLSALRLYLELLERQFDTEDIPANRRESLRNGVARAIKQTDNLVQLGNRLLDVSQINSGRLVIRIAETDLAAVVRNVIERLSDDLAHARCPLRPHVEPSVRGFWDHVRLEQVVTNLLTNAIKYAPGEPIDIELESDAQTATLRLRDRGPGIAAEDRMRIFGRFERTVSSMHTAGWGLGLYVTRQIVELHGGMIEVESEPPHGATFIVRLPRGLPDGWMRHPGDGAPSTEPNLRTRQEVDDAHAV